MRILKRISITIFILLSALTAWHFTEFKENERKLDIVNDKYYALQAETFYASEGEVYGTDEEWEEMKATYLKEVPYRLVEYKLGNAIKTLSFVLCFIILLFFIVSLKEENIPIRNKVLLTTPILLFILQFFHEWITTQYVPYSILKYFLLPFFILFISFLVRGKAKDCLWLILIGVFSCAPLLLEHYEVGGYHNTFERQFFVEK